MDWDACSRSSRVSRLGLSEWGGSTCSGPVTPRGFSTLTQSTRVPTYAPSFGAETDYDLDQLSTLSAPFVFDAGAPQTPVGAQHQRVGFDAGFSTPVRSRSPCGSSCSRASSRCSRSPQKVHFAKAQAHGPVARLTAANLKSHEERLQDIAELKRRAQRSHRKSWGVVALALPVLGAVVADQLLGDFQVQMPHFEAVAPVH